MSGAWDWDADAVGAYVAEALGEPVGTPERLPGGLLNVVWRVPAADRAVIAKIAPPFVAALPDVPLDVARQRVEAAALAAFADGGPLADLATDAARPPRPLHHDPGRSVVLMEDVGDLPDLAAALSSGKVDAARVGEGLGRFIGALHAAPATDPVRQTWTNPGAQATRLAVQYRAVGGALAAAGVPDADALGAEAVALGERFQDPGRCLIQGDLWPPSVLVSDDGALRVIDWELAHVGQPGQDLGHLGAHFWMLAHRRPGVAEAARAGWRAFLRGYAHGAGAALPRLLTADVLDDAARHLGCEVLVRAAGPFQGGTAYDGLSPRAPAVREATQMAAEALRTPETCPVLDDLRGVPRPEEG